MKRIIGSFFAISFCLIGCQKNTASVGTTLVHGASGAVQPVEYLKQDGLAVFEGDIILGSVEEAEAAKQAERLAPENTHGAIANRIPWTYWSSKTIPYYIDPKLPNPQRALDAIAHWKAKTSLRFVPRTNEFSYVSIEPHKSGCMSALGRVGGRTRIRISDRCGTGAIIHELGHAVGLWHEQSRSDRDQFITILWDNIEADAKGQFTKNWLLARDHGTYNYNSIMHYDAYAFSKNGKPTITRKDGSTQVGQRVGLSSGDIEAVENLYR